MDLKQLTLLLQEKIEASNLGITKCISYVTPIINYVRDVRALPFIYTTYVSNNEIIRRKYNIYLLLPNIKIPILLAIGHTIDSISLAKNKEEERASRGLCTCLKDIS